MMNTDLMKYVLEILEKRANEPDRDASSRVAYSTAVELIKYAQDGSEECIRQFDY